jgi:hypothetical protein
MINSEVIKKALTEINNTVNYEYFFKKISSSDWIKPLEKKGFFKYPPQPIKQENFTRFPVWVESEYLARMASHAPDIVADVALSIPETDNVRVHEDLTDIALNVPVNLAIKFVPKIKKWLKSSYLVLIAEKVAKLMVKLAKEGEVDSVLELMKILLQILPIEDVENTDKSPSSFRSEPRIRLDSWEYREILENYIPHLVDTIGYPVLEILVDLLEQAIQFSENDSIDQEYSTKNLIWIRYYDYNSDIDDDSYNHKEIETSLARSVRETAKKIIKKNPESLDLITSLLRQKHWLIFHKILLFILNEFSEINFDLVINALINHEYFELSRDYLKEYFKLAHDQFSFVPKESQNIFLDWIENLKLDFEEEQETKEKYIRYKKFQMLTIIKNHLSFDELSTYQALEDEFGELNYSDLIEKKRPSVADYARIQTPKTSDELISLSKDELVSFLKSWQPTSQNSFDSPSVSGLEQEIKKMAEKTPEHFASIAVQFKGLNPRYCVGILRGLYSALQSREKNHLNTLNWSSILDLCYWIVNSSQEIRDWKKYDNPLTPDWGEPRRAVLDIIDIGLRLDDSLKIPFDFCEKIWDLLLPMTSDADPTPEHESNYKRWNEKNGFISNVISLRLNTIRSKAIETGICYALWIRRYYEKDLTNNKLPEQEFNSIPQISQIFRVLEEHLDKEKDSSLGVHSVYGAWLRQLTYLDSNWITLNISNIFPHGKNLEQFRRAAWETYLQFSDVKIPIYEMLKDEYLYAVENLNVRDKTSSYPTEAEKRLIDHLMLLHSWGVLHFDQSDSLLNKFYEKASDNFRGHAIDFIGRSLSNIEGEIHPEILERLRYLWKKRIDEAKQSSNTENHTEEISAFSWWFKSEKFDDKWSVEQLKEALTVIEKVNHLFQYRVIDRLIHLASKIPVEVIDCISLMVRKNDNYIKENEIKSILQLIFQLDNEQAKEKAIALVHYLGSINYWKFRELLPNSN